MKKIFLASFIASLLLLSACGGGDPVVYMSGFSMDEDSSTANYWKGEEVSNLPPSDTTIATSIFADSDFTYIAGVSGMDDDARACYWTGDGTIKILSDKVSIANDIYVEGTNIYVSGLNDGKIGYWVNGTFKVLDNDADAFVLSIYVKDGIVYTAGMVDDKAVYWKGTTKYELSSLPSSATSVEVDGDDVIYVAGQLEDKAVYWKAGVVTELTDGTTQAIATSIDVANGDVYVTGLYDDFSKLAYWKNDLSGKVNLEVTDPYSADVFELIIYARPTIQTDGTTVYVSSPLVKNPSDPIFVGGLWKDGVLTVKEGYAYSSLFVRW